MFENKPEDEMKNRKSDERTEEVEISEMFRIIKKRTGKEPGDFNTADMSAILQALGGNPLGILP